MVLTPRNERSKPACLPGYRSGSPHAAARFQLGSSANFGVVTDHAALGHMSAGADVGAARDDRTLDERPLVYYNPVPQNRVT